MPALPQEEFIEQAEPSEPLGNSIPDDLMYSYARQIAEALPLIYCLENGKFYIYKQAYWQPLFDLELLSLICQVQPKINRYTLDKRNQVLGNLKVIVQKHLKDFNEHHYINFLSGMFSPDEEKLYNHVPEYYSTLRMPYDYNWGMNCPLWVKTLNEILEDDQEKVRIVQEFFGYCLTKDTSQRKALLLLGESNCGKSTILNVLRAMIGSANCSSVPLRFLSNPQYTPMLINKLVNIDSDVSQKAQEFEAEFKVITSGEPVSCNQKFIAAFEFVPYCKIVLAANIFPRITDHSSAFYNRLILIPCNRIFSEKEQNKRLITELMAELPGIFNWAVEGLHALNKRGMFEQCDFMVKAVKELEDENNPTNEFFNEYVQVNVSENSQIERGDLYSKYKEWSRTNEQFAISSAKFSRCVIKKFAKSTPPRTQCPITGKRIWKNLIYKIPLSHGQQIDIDD